MMETFVGFMLILALGLCVLSWGWPAAADKALAGAVFVTIVTLAWVVFGKA